MNRSTVKFSWIYSLMRFLLRLGLKLYYREFKIQGYEMVPHGEATFLAVNHQNAFMDAMVVAVAIHGRNQPSYITRADVFNAKTLKFLELWKMLPIYRQRDGTDYIQQNERVFARFIELLKMGETLLIFPEGNHGRVRKLRVLRKGIGRIAFQAMDQMEGEDKNVKIVPVGLNYSHHLNLRSDMLLLFGKPLDVKDYYEEYKQNDRKVLISLRNDLSEAMKENMIHIKSQDYYECIEGLREIASEELLQRYPSPKKDSYHRFLAEKEMIAKVEQALEKEEIGGEVLKEEVSTYLEKVSELGIRDHVVRRQPYSTVSLLLRGLGLLLGLPIFLYGYLNHALVYHVSIFTTRKMFKDDHFHSSVMFLMAFALFPISYLIQSRILWAFTDWKWALAYFLSLPLTGNFALIYSRWFKKWRGQWKFHRLLSKGEAVAGKLVQQRADIMEKLMGIMEEKTGKSEKKPNPSET